MRCDVLKCVNNDEGFCLCDSYVWIDENGQCKEMFVRTESEEAEDE